MTKMKYFWILLIRVCIYSDFAYFINANHFRGGTISWKSTGNGNEVQFSFKLGWAYGTGPGCNPSLVGQLVTGMNTTYWRCTMGCNGAVNIDNVNYICTGASRVENWEQGERTFTYTFPGTGPYKVEFTGGAWVALDYGSPGSWSIGTLVYLGKRSDTHQPNTSPVTTGKPLYMLYSRLKKTISVNVEKIDIEFLNDRRVQFGCRNEILIPVVDADSDDVRCRWSTGSECVSICNALPSATIDSRTCTISFPSNHTSSGTFAVAVSVEDFPKSTITIGSKVYTTNNPISSVTLQFLIKTPPLLGSCNDKPTFVSPTPSRGSTIQTNILRTFQLSFYATDSRRITRMDITSPAGMTYTSLQSVPSQPGKVFITTTWLPQQNQVGTHIVCAVAEDTLGKTSESRCININVNEMTPLPVKGFNLGLWSALTAIEQGGIFIAPYLQQVTSVCDVTSEGPPNLVACYDKQRVLGIYPNPDPHGVGQNVSPCVSSPCRNGATCVRQGITQTFTCSCVPGYTDHLCQTDINECAGGPCQNLGTCHDHINRFTCSCRSGFTGILCQIDINECLSDPCQHNGTCTDFVNRFECSCVPGFTDVICQTDIDECASQPCQNNGSCIDLINQFQCRCAPGFTGTLCQTDINECASTPCLNMATCNDLVNHFTCSCQAGFTGTLCEIDIDECASGPCSVLFDCVDRVNAYYCRLIVWKLVLIVSSVLFILTVISNIILFLKRRNYRDVDHTWLSHFNNIGKPDAQSRVIFKGRLPYQKF